jgi:hypothetical protein
MGILKSQDQAETRYPLSGSLRLTFSQTYDWRVDSITTDSTVLHRKLWSFTMEPFVRPIDTNAISAAASSTLADIDDVLLK